MKCPKCGREIDFVWVESTCLQKGYLEGDKVVDYGAIDTIGETVAIYCPECDEKIEVEEDA